MVRMDHILFAHLPVDGQWAKPPPPWLLWTSMNTSVQTFLWNPAFISFGCLCRVELLDRMVTLCLTSDNAKPFPPLSAPFPPASPMCSNSSYNTTFCFLIVANCKRCKGSALGLLSHVLLELCLTSETLRQQLPLTGHAALWWVAKLQGHKGSTPSSALLCTCCVTDMALTSPGLFPHLWNGHGNSTFDLTGL